MTHRATCRLPKKPSELIRVAIADLKKAEKSQYHTVYMGTWHDKGTIEIVDKYDPATCKTTKANPKVLSSCTVCLAGSVMAFTLKAPITAQLEPEDYSDSIANALYALDNFRCGAIRNALASLGISDKQKEKAIKAFGLLPQGNYDITKYQDDRTAFKREMLAMAKKLEDIGL